MDKEWRREMVSLRDSMFECPDCEAENFFNVDTADGSRSWTRGRTLQRLPSHSIA